MKVYIGPYISYCGPYQLTDALKYLGVGEAWRDRIGDWLHSHGATKVCQYVYYMRKRKIKIRVDDYDIWSADATLRLIILPVLRKLKAAKAGAPWVEDEDVPEELKSTSAPPKENEWDVDDNHFKRWDWVLNEVIWAFEIEEPGWDDAYYGEDAPDMAGLKKVEGRIANGHRLFGKYYGSLWS